MKTIKKNLILDNGHYKIYNNIILTNSGKEKEHLCFGDIKNNKTKGVIVLPVKKEYVYIGKEYRYGIQKYIYNLPSGGLEKKYSELENALKELNEETGLYSDKIKPLNIKSYESPSIRNNELLKFIAHDVYEKKKYTKDDTENFKDLEKFHIKDLFNKIINGDIEINTTSIPLIFYYYNLIN